MDFKQKQRLAFYKYTLKLSHRDIARIEEISPSTVSRTTQKHRNILPERTSPTLTLLRLKQLRVSPEEQSSNKQALIVGTINHVVVK